MPFVNPDTVHVPATSSVAPASWGTNVNANLNILGTPPRCRVSRSTTLSIVNNTVTAVNWNAESWDTDTMHDTSTNPSRFTAFTAGKYALVANLVWAAAAGQRNIDITMNGGAAIGQAPADCTNITFDCGIYVYCEVQMAVADYLEIRAWQNSGGGLNLQTTSWAAIKWTGT